MVVDFQGEIVFTKDFDDPNLLVLQYDPDADGPEDFRDVPACDVTFDGESTTPVLPEGDSWCYFGVEAFPISEGKWEVRWQAFGNEDPKFR